MGTDYVIQKVPSSLNNFLQKMIHGLGWAPYNTQKSSWTDKNQQAYEVKDYYKKRPTDILTTKPVVGTLSVEKCMQNTKSSKYK